MIARMAIEHTFIMVKPDGVERGLVGEVISRFEKKGFSLVRMQMLTPTSEIATEHYAEHVDKPFFGDLLEFITRGPVVAMEWSGEEAVASARNIMGATNPTNAAPGSIRGDLASLLTENIVHGSDSVESAQRELSIWF